MSFVTCGRTFLAAPRQRTVRFTAFGPLPRLSGSVSKLTFLAVLQAGQAGSLHGRDVYEDVALAVVGCDETVTLVEVEELHGTVL